MNEESAEFKRKKQLPAPDCKKGKRGKFAGKKPWTIEGEWKAGSIFSRTIRSRIDGEWSEETFTKTLEEIKADRSNNDFDWSWRLYTGYFQNYKTKKAALQAWENFKNKNDHYCMAKKNDDRIIYKLINKVTGEKEILQHEKKVDLGS